MLTIPERHKVVEVFRICSIVVPLPIGVDLAKWELKIPSIRKRWVSLVSYSLFVLHSLYKHCSLVYACIFVRDVQLHQIVIHAVVAIASGIFIAFWYFEAYIRDSALFAAFVKTTLLGNIGGPLDVNDQPKKHWTARLREYSRQDLIARSLPYIVPFAAAIICVSFAYEPSMSLLLYAALPCNLQNWVTFGLCLLEEIRFMLVIVSVAVPILQMQVLSIDLVSSQFQFLLRTVENQTSTSRSLYKSLRSLQLYISMLNNVNSCMIFTWKLVSITLCIISGYAALAHFREHPLFGIMYYVCFFDCAVAYAVVYEKAFKIPRLFEQAATYALLRTRGRRTSALRRQMISIPRTGIKVGHFHTMERVSTLIFINYVVINIVNMLVAYG